jgi:type I restriction enzyme, S subunit
MEVEPPQLPRFLEEMRSSFGEALRLARVDHLVNEGILFVEDGNHGEYRPRQHEFGTVGVPFVRPPDLVNGRIDLTACERINREARLRVRKGIGRGGDVVLSHRATVGRLALTSVHDPEFVTNPGTTVWRTLNENLIDRLYLFYFMHTPAFQEQLLAEAGNTSTFPYVSLTQQRRLWLALPQLETQQSIGRVLGALDDKIEQNRRTGRALEALARATFKAWFVDFEPVNAKAVGQTSFPGMPLDAFAAVPDRLIDSPLGLVPNGWEVKTIHDLCHVVDCLHTKKPEQIAEGDRLLLQLNNIRDDGLLDLTTQYLISPSDYLRWSAKFETQRGDLVITNVGRVGAVAQVPPGVAAALGRNMTGLRPRSNFPYPTFLLEALLSSALREEIVRHTDTGTILSALNVKNIGKLRLVVPVDNVLRTAEAALRPIRALMEHGLAESRKLAALRDYLLPRLMSGRIRAGATNV